MKLKVLTDNNVFYSNNLMGEHGLSFYIQEENKNILFDTGRSDIFLKNSQVLGINLSNISFIVLSHRHHDHIWGLNQLFNVANFLPVDEKSKIKILTHPDTIFSRKDPAILDYKKKIEKFFNLNLTQKPFWITDKLVFFRRNSKYK